MPIEFDCPHCGCHLSLWDELAGKQGKCPKCNKGIIVPRGASTDIMMACPQCGADIPAGSKLCTQCGRDLRRGTKLETRVNEPGVLRKAASESLGPIVGMLWRYKFLLAALALFFALMILLFSLFGKRTIDPARKLLEDGPRSTEGR